MKRTQSLTAGSISGSILRFALPLFLGQLLQQFYNMADAWVIGNFANNSAFAAVSSGGNLTFMIIGFFNGIGIGGGVVISRYFGAKDNANTQKAIHNAFLFGLLASLIATAAGLLFIPKMLVLMRTPVEVLPYSLQYFRVYFGGVTTIVLYNVCMSIMQAQGDSLRPLYYLGVSSVTNVVLDLVFVAGFHWDVMGAAVATVIAQGLSVVLCLRRMRREPEAHLRLDFRLLRWDRAMMSRIIRQGLPTGIQNSVIGLGSTLLIAWNIRGQYATLEETFRHAAFQVSSITTTTGFATTDFDQWPSFSKTILLCLMVIGASAGSTGGGMKVSRLILLFKSLRRSFLQMLHPRRVQLIRNNGQVVDDKVVETTNAYLIAYVFILFLSFLLLSLDGFSTGTNFSAVLCCFNNIGPGLEAVGPTCNFSGFSILSKLVLIFDMLLGRLEIFPILCLFSRHTWHRTVR